MPELKHTPAPWEIRSNKIFIPNTYKCVAVVCVQDAWDNLKFQPKEDIEAIANAKLIAAAPELLEALKNLTGCMYRSEFKYLGQQLFYDKAIEAIKKATK